MQSVPGKEKPALVLRTDVANVYGTVLPKALFSRMIENAVEQALQLDAACVVVNLFSIPDEPEVTDQCIQNILKIKPENIVYSFGNSGNSCQTIILAKDGMLNQYKPGLRS